MVTFIGLLMSFILGFFSCFLYYNPVSPSSPGVLSVSAFSDVSLYSSIDRSDYCLMYPVSTQSRYRTFVANSVSLDTSGLTTATGLSVEVQYDETDEVFAVTVNTISSTNVKTKTVSLFFGSLDPRTPNLRSYFNSELTFYAYGYSRPNGQLNGLHVIQVSIPFGGATGTETFNFSSEVVPVNSSDLVSLFSDDLAAWQFCVCRTTDFVQSTQRIAVSAPSQGVDYVEYLTSPFMLYMTELTFSFSPPITANQDSYEIVNYLFGTYLNGARLYCLPQNNSILDADDFYLLSADVSPLGHSLKYYNSTGSLVSIPFELSDTSLLSFDVDNFSRLYSVSFYQSSDIWDAPSSIVDGINEILSVNLFGTFSLGNFLLIAGCILLGFFFLKIFMGG